MGATFTPGAASLSLIDFVKSEFNFTRNGVSSEVIDHSIKGSVVYVAVKYVKDGKEEVYGAVADTWKEGDGRGIKIIDESMGPYQCNCPKRIIDKLSPTDSEYANEWRKACLEPIAKKPVLKVGVKIQFDEPLKFTDGTSHSQFSVVKSYVKGKLKTVYQSPEGKLYQISRISKMNYKICA